MSNHERITKPLLSLFVCSGIIHAINITHTLLNAITCLRLEIKCDGEVIKNNVNKKGTQRKQILHKSVMFINVIQQYTGIL